MLGIIRAKILLRQEEEEAETLFAMAEWAERPLPISRTKHLWTQYLSHGLAKPGKAETPADLTS